MFRANRHRARGRGATGVTTLGKEAIDRLVEEEARSFKKKAGQVEVNATRNRRQRQSFVTTVAKKELVFLPKKKKVPVNNRNQAQPDHEAWPRTKRVVRLREHGSPWRNSPNLIGDKSFGRYEEAHRHGHDGDHQSCARLRHGNPDWRTSTAMKSKTFAFKEEEVIKKSRG